MKNNPHAPKERGRTEGKMFGRLKADLRIAFVAPEGSYGVVTANEVIDRNPASPTA